MIAVNELSDIKETIMLTDFYIEKVLKDCMQKYADTNDGKIGLAKVDVIQEVLTLGGDLDDVHEVMALGASKIIGRKCRILH